MKLVSGDKPLFLGSQNTEPPPTQEDSGSPGAGLFLLAPEGLETALASQLRRMPVASSELRPGMLLNKPQSIRTTPAPDRTILLKMSKVPKFRSPVVKTSPSYRLLAAIYKEVPCKQ